MMNGEGSVVSDCVEYKYRERVCGMPNRRLLSPTAAGRGRRDDAMEACLGQGRREAQYSVRLWSLSNWPVPCSFEVAQHRTPGHVLARPQTWHVCLSRCIAERVPFTSPI